MSQDNFCRATQHRRWITDGLKLVIGGALGFGIAALVFDSDAPPVSTGPAAMPENKEPVRTGSRTSTPPAHLHATLSVANAFELARTDSSALERRIADTKEPEARLALIRGLFAHFADSLPPREAISQALRFEKAEQEAALRELAAVWLGVGPETLTGGTQGASAVLRGGLALIQSDKARPGTAEAWVSVFREHPARLELASAFAAKLTVADPERALAMADGFTAWERSAFYAGVIPAWARHDPEAARRWQADTANAATEADRQRFWRAVAYSQPEWASKALAGERDPAARLEAVRGIAAIKAHQGTREAIAWADGLTDSPEREVAHDIIYEATPRGISAVLGTYDGYPEIREALAGGAAAAAGMQSGDRIVEVTGADGKTVSLYNQPIEFAVKQLQGEAGESVTLRFLRNGPDGKPAEKTVTVVRSQIVLPPETARAKW